MHSCRIMARTADVMSYARSGVNRAIASPVREQDGGDTPAPWHSVAAMEHDHHHQGGHSHGGGHSFDRAFAIGTALNLGFVVAEVGFGLAANSIALLADAAHNLGDVLGL